MSRRISIQEFNLSNKVSALNIPRIRSARNAILGIGCLSHDTSASLVDIASGEILFAQSEERDSNLKHDSGFPIYSLLRSVEFAKEKSINISKIALNFNPNLFLLEGVLNLNKQIDGSAKKSMIENVFEIVDEYVVNNENNFVSLVSKVESELHKFDLKLEYSQKETFFYLLQFHKYKVLYRIISNLFPELEIETVRHHDSHAASALFSFGEIAKAAIIVMDGHGELDSCSIYSYKGTLERISTSRWPFSVGSLYLSATRHLNYDYGDEYKVMGMAAYGKPRFFDLLSELIFVDKSTGILSLKQNSYLNTDYVKNTGQKRIQFTEEFHEICPPRNKNQDLSMDNFDLASSIQKLTEHLGKGLADFAFNKSGFETLYISGGVGLNGLMNNWISENSEFKELKIFSSFR